MKAYTDIEQSKQLAEILPIESADMYYHPYPNDEYWYDVPNIGNADLKYNQLPCWSLSALLAQMPCVELVSSNDGHYRAFWHDMYSEWHESAVDACVELLERVRKEEEK